MDERRARGILVDNEESLSKGASSGYLHHVPIDADTKLIST